MTNPEIDNNNILLGWKSTGKKCKKKGNTVSKKSRNFRQRDSSTPREFRYSKPPKIVGKFHGSLLSSSKESLLIRQLIVKNRRNLYISLSFSFKFIAWKIVINERKVRTGTRIDNNAIYHYYCYYYYCYYPENLPLRPSILPQPRFNEPFCLVINNRQSNIKLILKQFRFE